MTTERLYRAVDTDGNTRLIRAANQAQVRAYLMRSTWAIETPTTLEVAEAVSAGARVEHAQGTEQESADA